MNKLNLKKLIPASLLFLTTSFTATSAGQNDAATYQSYLDNLFADKSCTVLKAEINTDNLTSNTNYINLPEPLKKMVMKIAGGDWSESYDYSSTAYAGTNGEWNSDYARKYRVQLYEPYSKGDDAASMAGIQPYTNMNNPTGIVGDAGNTIYVMVEDEIPAGTSLYIDEVADYDLHNSVTSGTKLSRGLNIITCSKNNAHFFIYYSVPTVSKPTGSNRFQPVAKYKLSQIPPVKIHIEGGRLNGFFNYVGDTRTDVNGEILYKPDTEDDFKYTIQRATNLMYDLIGKYVILHFHLYDTDKGGTDPIKGVRSSLFSNKTEGSEREYNPVNIMTAWDEMCLNERILMGLQSDEEIAEYNSINGEKILNDKSKIFYSSIVNTGDKVTGGNVTYSLDPGYHYNDYFNNRLMGLSQDREGLFMSATSWRMNFHINTVDQILTQFNKGEIWGPAHEYGHINQGPMNMAGTTEESNNIFSNVAVYFIGKQSSRSDFISSEFKIFQEGKNFLENGTWGTTRMFWQLWCYYHATGHNTKFYPRLYELLRNNPLQKITRPGKHNMRYDQLHFAKMCCLAAQEDLTDFFTAWGFFVPMDMYPIEDYNSYDAYLTDEDIKAVKDEIAAFGFDKNEAIILIDDRPGSTRKSFDGFPKENAGQYGGLEAFRNEEAPEGDFSFKINMNTVTVSKTGSPGAGYIIRDAEGNLLGFSNSDVFEVSDELAAKLRSGEASVKAVGANNETAEVTNLLLDGSNDEKIEILNGLISKTAAVLAYVDDDAVGYLRTEAAAPLQQLLKEAQNGVTSGNATSEELSSMIDRLSSSYIKILSDKESFVKVETGNTYQITSNYYKNLVLTTDKTKLTAQTRSNTESLIQQWYFEPAGEEDTYYLMNVETGQYIKGWDATGRIYAMSTSEPFPYDLQNKQNDANYFGVFGIASHGTNQGLHYNNGMTYWSTATTSPASMWTIRKVHDATDDAIADKQKQIYYGMLQALIGKYEALKSDIDPTNSNVGYFRPGADEIFDIVCDNIRAFINRDDATSAECVQFYAEQLELYDKTIVSPEVCIRIEPGAAYIITNVNESNRRLSTNDTNLESLGIDKDDTLTTRWVFESTDNSNLFALRNLSIRKYVSSNGISYDKEVPMKETGDYFGLVRVPGSIGVFGISAYLDPANSLIMVGNNIRVSVLSSDQARWTIKKILDRDFVEKHDRLGELMDHGRELTLNWDYTIFPEWLETYQLMDDMTDAYKSTTISAEELQECIEKLESNLAYADALVDGSEIINFVSAADFNDRADENTESNGIRHAFNPNGELRFENIVTLGKEVDASSIIVSATPINGGNWTKINNWATDLQEEYMSAFSKYLTDDNFFNWFESADIDRLDGFLTTVSAKLEEGDTPGVYTLVINAPCSGMYQIQLYSATKDIAIFDADKKIPSFTVEVYPNLTEDYGIKGLIIDNYTFGSEHEGLQKTIVLPDSYIKNNDLTNCRIYVPGVYFAGNISAVWTADNDNETDGATAVIEKLSSYYPISTTYFATVDLSSLKSDSKSGTLNVAVSKNGANANFAFHVKAGDKDVETSVGTTVIDVRDNCTYYNLQGQKVNNPGKGIYIRIKNGKSEKIVL